MSNFRLLNILYPCLFSLLLLFSFISCEKPLPALNGIDLMDWKKDKNGCSQKRASMITSLKEQRNKLQGLTETQIIKLLGRPDHNELYKRNQKFFSYYLQHSPTCPSDSLASVKLVLRFNAMGRAKEIMVE